MGIFQFWGAREPDREMARKQSKPDSANVDAWARQLKAAMKDAEAFKALYASFASTKDLSAGEAIEVAHKVTGIRPKTKKQAVTSIGQEQLRLAHAKAKAESAAKARTW